MATHDHLTTDASTWLVPVALLVILCLVDVAASANLILQPAAGSATPLLAAAANAFGLPATAVLRMVLLALCAGALVTGQRRQPSMVAPLLRGATLAYALLLVAGVLLGMMA